MFDIKKVALTVGISIVLALFIVFLMDAVYSQPKYEDYCSENIFPQRLNPISNCTGVYNESLFNSCYKEKGEIRYKYDDNGCEKEIYCDYCYKVFNEAHSKYNKNLFYLFSFIALLSIIVGLYLPKNFDIISPGLMFGGIIILLQGTVRVFGDLDKVTRVIILGLDLLILIWIGYKKIKK